MQSKLSLLILLLILFQELSSYSIDKKADEPLSANDRVIISTRGGIYENSFDIKLTNIDSTFKIFYTIDGSKPTIHSLPYSNDITLDQSQFSKNEIFKIKMSPNEILFDNDYTIPKCIVIRAASFDMNGIMVSEIETNSYFIKELGSYHNNIPIVSINTDYKGLFDYESGIFVPGIHFSNEDPDWTGNYFQRGDDWEREAYIEYYDPISSEGFHQNCGIRTHGGNSRRQDQKAIRLYARNQYGKSSFSYPIFPDKNIKSFKRLLLKPFSSSWSQAGIEDVVCNKIAATTNIDVVAFRPVVLYINGEYWGIYYLQERIDKYFIEDNFGIKNNKIDIIEGWYGEAVDGNGDDFKALYDFILDNDLSTQQNYQKVLDWIDIDNFIDYQLTEIFVANYDWPVNNMKCWRESKPNGKYRWIFYDGDASLQDLSFNGFANALSTSDDNWPTNAHSTLFLRKLLENYEFKSKFFNRLAFLLSTSFNSDNLYLYINESLSNIKHEVENQMNRFRLIQSISDWSEKIKRMHQFADFRTCEIAKQCKKIYKETLHTSAKCQDYEVIISDVALNPNPNSGNFTFSLSSSKFCRGKIVFSNILGQVLYESDCILYEGYNPFIFNNIKLPKGVIVATIITHNGIISTTMISLSTN